MLVQTSSHHRIADCCHMAPAWGEMKQWLSTALQKSLFLKQQTEERLQQVCGQLLKRAASSLIYFQPPVLSVSLHLSAKPHAWIAPCFPYPSWQTFMKRIYCSLWDNWKIQLKKGEESSSMKQMETWALVHHLSYFSQRRLLFLLSSSPCHEASLG